MDWRNQNSQNAAANPLAQSPSVAGVTIAPSRQPKGPDGSKGFSDLYLNYFISRRYSMMVVRYRSARKHACSFSFSENHAVHEIPAVV